MLGGLIASMDGRDGLDGGIVIRVVLLVLVLVLLANVDPGVDMDTEDILCGKIRNMTSGREDIHSRTRAAGVGLSIVMVRGIAGPVFLDLDLDMALDPRMGLGRRMDGRKRSTLFPSDAGIGTATDIQLGIGMMPSMAADVRRSSNGTGRKRTLSFRL